MTIKKKYRKVSQKSLNNIHGNVWIFITDKRLNKIRTVTILIFINHLDSYFFKDIWREFSFKFLVVWVNKSWELIKVSIDSKLVINILPRVLFDGNYENFPLLANFKDVLSNFLQADIWTYFLNHFLSEYGLFPLQ